MLKSVWYRFKGWFSAKPSSPPPVVPYKPPQAPNKPTTPSKPAETTSADAFLRKRLVQLVERDIGQREDNGKNRSKLIDSINRELASLGDPYCISGLLIRGVKDLCHEQGLKNPVTMTASTQEFYDSAPGKFKRPKGTAGKKADICIQQSRTSPGSGHAYILSVDQPTADSIQQTIEYNTDGSGGRDGDGVYRRQRSQSGDLAKKYRGSVDVVAWIISANPNWKPVEKVAA